MKSLRQTETSRENSNVNHTRIFFLMVFIDNKSPSYLTHMPWLSIKTSYRVWLSVVALRKPLPFEILPLNSFVEIEISQNLGEEPPLCPFFFSLFYLQFC